MLQRVTGPIHDKQGINQIPGENYAVCLV